MTEKNCPNCAAPLPLASPTLGLSCEFCHTVVQQPELTILDAEIIEEQPPGGGEPAWAERLRLERLDVKREHALLVVRQLLCIFLVLVPGILTAVLGTVFSSLAGNVRLAAICLVAGVVSGGVGIASVVYFGLGQKRCNERIRDLARRANCY